eukprot:3739827-Amphidinium_carterae.2
MLKPPWIRIDGFGPSGHCELVSNAKLKSCVVMELSVCVMEALTVVAVAAAASSPPRFVAVVVAGATAVPVAAAAAAVAARGAAAVALSSMQAAAPGARAVVRWLCWPHLQSKSSHAATLSGRWSLSRFIASDLLHLPVSTCKKLSSSFGTSDVCYAAPLSDHRTHHNLKQQHDLPHQRCMHNASWSTSTQDPHVSALDTVVPFPGAHVMGILACCSTGGDAIGNFGLAFALPTLSPSQKHASGFRE